MALLTKDFLETQFKNFAGKVNDVFVRRTDLVDQNTDGIVPKYDDNGDHNCTFGFVHTKSGKIDRKWIPDTALPLIDGNHHPSENGDFMYVSKPFDEKVDIHSTIWVTPKLYIPYYGYPNVLFDIDGISIIKIWSTDSIGSEKVKLFNLNELGSKIIENNLMAKNHWVYHLIDEFNRALGVTSNAFNLRANFYMTCDNDMPISTCSMYAIDNAGSASQKRVNLYPDKFIDSLYNDRSPVAKFRIELIGDDYPPTDVGINAMSYHASYESDEDGWFTTTTELSKKESKKTLTYSDLLLLAAENTSQVFRGPIIEYSIKNVPFSIVES